MHVGMKIIPKSTSILVGVIKYGVSAIQAAVVRALVHKHVEPVITDNIITPAIEYATNTNIFKTVATYVLTTIGAQGVCLSGAGTMDKIGAHITNTMNSSVLGMYYHAAKNSCSIFKSMFIILPLFLVMYYAISNTIIIRHIYKNKKNYATTISLGCGIALLGILGSYYYCFYKKQMLIHIFPALIRNLPFLLQMNIILFYIYGIVELNVLIRAITNQRQENENYLFNAFQAFLIGVSLIIITTYGISVGWVYFATIKPALLSFV
ncbi:hypothetical protein NEPAR06_2095 [Nematocida parisii]|uniref:Uncharacterized protein n=2 Tax=Nematocida parisii TaxID=586133 RepID=I3EG11_NEMP3|nr:hypothetical protein NEQG_01602 [Nematocida parisii ERTm3]KAI5155974.1 hypothetical protein NEPAR06_2095 [Nematocida parisii]KAI5158415.1 hypothetical protein NEPAR05_1958 [Nematocida parisii]